MPLESLIDLSPFTWQGLLTAIACGSLIGLERQSRGKPVGIRTSALITLGTYVFIVISISLNNDITDPSRIIGQVITGIGFLGAGVMLARDGAVQGVTSAATIWVLAGIGICIATGHWLAALKIALITVAILRGVDLLESAFQTLRRGVHTRYQARKRPPPDAE
ncbi:MgtC/SapB family protein [Kistimonas scapharcae]|uniref:Protein MgtC n=1 Tax=Kistimonas scapharcae TaxID=1036133 RepID=A0ABP8V1D1_9GAMM